MKIFLVNMDRNSERLVAADAQLKSLGVSYERFSAVDGATLSFEVRKAAVNRFRWRCAVGRSVRVGEIGCAMSHYSIYRRMIEEGIPVVCVLEDDVVLADAFPEQLKRVEEWVNPDLPQVVLLSNHTPQTAEGPAIVPAERDMYTEGYVLTLPAARALLRANWPMQVPCDHWGRWVKRGAIALYHAFPTVCSQNRQDFGSTTVSVGSFDVRNLSLPARLGYKCYRGVGRFFDWLMG